MRASGVIPQIFSPRILRASGRLFLGALCISAVVLLLPHATADEHPASSLVLQLNLDREVEPVLATYIDEGLADAARRHAALVLITMDTPGGLSDSMKDIIQHILASPVPVAVYVSPTGARGASAGFFILLSADIAAMALGTHTGAASPILAIGGFQMQVDETMRRKIMNDATAFLRSYTEKRGRNPSLAETAVTDAKAFTEREALQGKLVDLVAASPEDLLHQLSGRAITRFDGTRLTLSLPSPVLSQFELSARQKFLARIVEPDVFFVLLIVGVLGLYTEFTHPGVIGIIAMMLGAMFLIRSPLTTGGVSLGVAVAATIPFAVITVFLMRLVLRSRTWKTTTGREELVGAQGVSVSSLAAGAEGMIRVHGELWRAVSDRAVPEGRPVRVVRIEGLKLNVEPAEASAPENK